MASFTDPLPCPGERVRRGGVLRVRGAKPPNEKGRPPVGDRPSQDEKRLGDYFGRTTVGPIVLTIARASKARRLSRGIGPLRITTSAVAS